MKIIKGTVEDKNGIYIAVKYSNNTEKALLDIQDKYDLPNVNTDFHTTLIYSKVGGIPIPEDYDSSEHTNLVETDVYSEIWNTKDGRTLVLLFPHTYLEEKHKMLMDKYGYNFDYDEYKPHITLSYDIGDLDISINEQIPMEITNGYYEPLNENYIDTDSSKTGVPSPSRGKSIKKRVPETKQDKFEKNRPKIG